MTWNYDEAISYYRSAGAPRDQNVLISLLREIQQHHSGHIPSYYLSRIAQSYEIKESILLVLIKRIPSLRLENSHCLELCAGPNCGKHKELADYAEKLKMETGSFELRFVPCMRKCGKGPNIRWDGKLFNEANIELLRKLIK